MPSVASVTRAKVPSEPAKRPPKVQVAVAEHVRQVVTAMVLRTLGPVLTDQLGVLVQEGGQPVDEIPLPRNGAGAAAVAQGLAAQLEDLPVGQNDLRLSTCRRWSRT